jgi:hypothetical protein
VAYRSTVSRLFQGEASVLLGGGVEWRHPGSCARGLSSLYGPMVWMVMSLIIIPALVHRAPTQVGGSRSGPVLQRRAGWATGSTRSVAR